MIACNQCRYWDEHWKREDGSAPCYALRLREHGQHVPRNGAAIFVRVADDHGLEVEFYTSPNFSCANFDQSSQRKA